MCRVPPARVVSGGELCLDADPHPPGGDGDIVGAAADLDGVNDLVCERVDPRDRAVQAVGHPDCAEADGDPGRAGADVDGGLGRARCGVDPRDVSVDGVGDPHRAGAHGDGARALADRDRGRDDPAAIDPRDGVVEVVGDPGRSGAVGDPGRLVADVGGGLDVARTGRDAGRPQPCRWMPTPSRIPQRWESWVRALPSGLPTWVRFTTLAKAGSMRRTVASGASIVHTAPPAVVTPSTLVPVDSVRTSSVRRGSKCDSESSSRFATQSPPAPAEMSPGRAPTGTCPTTALRAGSMTATELAFTETRALPWWVSSPTSASNPAASAAPASVGASHRRRPVATRSPALVIGRFGGSTCCKAGS